MELLLANGRKIVVNVARIKPYFSSAANSTLSSPSFNGSLHSDLTTDNANGFLTTKAFSDSNKTFAPPTLTPTHTRKPGRPRNLAEDSKVLSPATVSFSKQGKDSHPGGVAVAKKNETEVTVARAHPMRTRSQKEEKEEISAIVQDALISRLNNVIERSYHCIVKKPHKKTQPRPGRPKLGLSYGDPYKYSSYPETGISEQPALNIGPFNDIVGDDYFDDSDGDIDQANSDSTSDHEYFDFDDILPHLEEDDNDVDGAFRRYEEEAGYHDEGEIHSPVPVQEPQNDPALLGPETPPHQRRGRITTPRRRLPAEEAGEPEGAVGGDVWEAPASLEAQTAFFSRLLDEIERYTEAAETTQRSVRALAPAVQQQVQVELRTKARKLQEQLEWAQATLAPQAISDAKLERAFRPRPLIPVTPPIRRASPARPIPTPAPTPDDGHRGRRGSQARRGRLERTTPAPPGPLRRTRSQDPAGSATRGRTSRR